MLSELRTRIAGFDPWSGAWFADNLFSSDKVLMNNDKVFALDNKLRYAFKVIFTERSVMGGVLGDPTDGAFEYPIAKRRTEANVIKMRAAEFNLDAFWKAVDSGVEVFAKISIPKFLNRRLLQPRKIYRTPAWVPPKVCVLLKRPTCCVQHHSVTDT